MMLLVVALCVSCKSTSSGDSTASSSASATPSAQSIMPSASTAPSVGSTAVRLATYPPTQAGVCRAFNAFYVAFFRYTAHQQARLIPIAEAVGRTAIRASQHTSRQFFLDATNLGAWVGSSSFPTTGSPLSKPFTRMQADCP